jgi:hypothetical protein
MKKIPLLYFFPHMYLKDAVLSQWPSLKNIIDKGPVIFKDWLVTNFNKMKEDPKDLLSNKDVVLTPSAFDLTMADMPTGKKLLVITFPPPQETTEVVFVGILVDEKPRYFTFELHRPSQAEKELFPERITDSYKLCEWGADGVHKLLKSSDDAQMSSFVSGITSILI